MNKNEIKKEIRKRLGCGLVPSVIGNIIIVAIVFALANKFFPEYVRVENLFEATVTYSICYLCYVGIVAGIACISTLSKNIRIRLIGIIFLMVCIILSFGFIPTALYITDATLIGFEINGGFWTYLVLYLVISTLNPKSKKD